MKRIGMLTSGGDCQALNATMRGVAKGLYNTFEDVEVYGFLEGYKGLIYGNYVKMKPSDFSGILTKGGTILGSSLTASNDPLIVLDGIPFAGSISDIDPNNIKSMHSSGCHPHAAAPSSECSLSPAQDSR